jgi:hypothetical protein
MLISMPTGTSTIFGAFQAILALLKVKPDEFRPFDNVMHIKKFASGIFCYLAQGCENIALHNILGGWYRVPVKSMTHQWVLLVSTRVGGRPARFGNFQIKQL